MSLLLSLLACQLGTVQFYEVCELDLEPSATVAQPGDIVTVSGGPFSEAYDTAISVDGTYARVVDVERVGCATCDTCISSTGCTTCGICLECQGSCRTCEQSVSFEVPAVIGTVPVAISNRHGAGMFLLTVLADTSDTGFSPMTGDTASVFPPTGQTGQTGATGMTGDTGHTGQ